VKVVKILTGHSDETEWPIYDKTSFQDLPPDKLLKLYCGTVDLHRNALGKEDNSLPRYYNPGASGYLNGSPVGGVFVKPRSAIQGIPTDGTPPIEIKVDKSQYRDHSSARCDTENALTAIFNEPFFHVTDSFQTTASDKVVRFGPKIHEDIEPIVALLRGQLVVDKLNYKALTQYHPTRSPLTELIRSAIVEIYNVPSDCPLTELCWRVEHAKTGHAPIFTTESPDGGTQGGRIQAEQGHY